MDDFTLQVCGAPTSTTLIHSHFLQDQVKVKSRLIRPLIAISKIGTLTAEKKLFIRVSLICDVYKTLAIQQYELEPRQA